MLAADFGTGEVLWSFLWFFIFQPDYGLLNYSIRLAGQVANFFVNLVVPGVELGIHGPQWLADTAWVKTAYVIMSLWGVGYTVVIYLAGLQDVPTSLYEASIIDGASGLQRLLHVTLPMISPVIYFNVVMGVIGGFQAFAQAMIMTSSTGAPEQSTLFYVLQLYNVGFMDMRMGYASAMAWVLFVIILVLTFAATQLSKRWVTYDR
jgi:multiple sugar transport system permease protein